MSQERTVGAVEDSVGYMLKQAATSLRTAMDAALRPLHLTVPQYSCLEVLAQRPGLSSAELARATFVTRQSMNLMLQGLLERGLLRRQATPAHGRALPAELTATGRARLHAASVAVSRVEQQMLAALTPTARRRLLADLTRCVGALAPTAPPEEGTAS